MKRLIRFAALIIVIGAVCLYFWPKSTHTAINSAKAVWNCSEGQDPCIQIVENGKPADKFNDFRFKSGGCITFDAYPAKAWKNYCGSYTLKWIGPTDHKPVFQQG